MRSMLVLVILAVFANARLLRLDGGLASHF
jgi:hypothetical protein